MNKEQEQKKLIDQYCNGEITGEEFTEAIDKSTKACQSTPSVPGKTAEEIETAARRYSEGDDNDNEYYAFKDGAEYASLQTASLQQENEELKDWKQQALRVMPDFQLIGKLLKVPLGHDVSDKIVPAIENLQQENERLREENRWLRFALQDIVDCDYFDNGIEDFENLQSIAQEALNKEDK